MSGDDLREQRRALPDRPGLVELGTETMLDAGAPPIGGPRLVAHPRLSGIGSTVTARRTPG